MLLGDRSLSRKRFLIAVPKNSSPVLSVSSVSSVFKSEMQNTEFTEVCTEDHEKPELHEA